MNAQQAWESVLQQVQMDMSKASFDRWVRDTEAVALEEEMLIVEARNAEACDWLASRLTSTVQRLLVGILNRFVSVRFIVADSPSVEPESEEDGQEVALEPVQWIDYEEVVRPQRQVVVKGYLRRLGAEVGAKAIWLYIGFHQAAWMAHDAGYKSGFVLHSRDILRFSGLSFGAFWRSLRQPDIRAHLAGLVERMDPAQARRYRTGRDGRPHRLPIRYRVFMTPRLTHADASVLYSRLKQSLEQGDSIGEALERCLSREDVLQLTQAREKAADAIRFTTVRDIARAAAQVKLSREADHLAQELHRKIMNSMGDIHITHYFITQIIRQFGLTPAQAWLVTVTRDMAYLNLRTGERREVVTFQGGYREMAELVGSHRPKTVQAWFHPHWTSEQRGGDLCQFMQELEIPRLGDYSDVRTATAPRAFHVQLDEPLDANGTNRPGANGSNRLDADGSNRTVANGTNRLDANGTVKNSFKHPLSTDIENTSNTGDPQTAEAAAPMSWDLKTLLQRNQVHPKVQRELLEAQVSARAFVSWVLFAAGREGKWISEPLGYAISRLRTEPGMGAGGAFDRLAALQPKALQNVIDLALEDPLGIGPHGELRYEKTWREAMGSNLHSLMTVRTILFGQGGLA